MENKNCIMIHLSDETRNDIIKYFNALRNERALTQDNLSQGTANMNIIVSIYLNFYCFFYLCSKQEIKLNKKAATHFIEYLLIFVKI